jgi:spore maturation protein CgeB
METTVPETPRLRILFVAAFSPGGNSEAHARVLEEFGCDVEVLNFKPYIMRGGRIATWIRLRTLAGISIHSLNKAILEAADRFKPDLVWAEKPVAVRPETFQKLRDRGVVLSCLTYDNPFGDMGEPHWRLFLESLPLFDLHVLTRRKSLQDFTDAGARNVLKISLSYDPARHFPPPTTWTEADRSIDVSFTGAPWDDRAERLLALWHRQGIAVDVRGNRWDKIPEAKDMAPLVKGSGVYGEAYRRRFWESRICLSFNTIANHDEVAHRSFEITASQGFMLSDRTDALLGLFTENEEAVYFSDLDECAEKIRRYLPDVAERERISRNARKRAVASGYSLPDQFARVLRALARGHESICEPENLPPEIGPNAAF